MNRIALVPTFAGWQTEARLALAHEIPPEQIFWQEVTGEQPVFAFPEAKNPAATVSRYRVPRAFLALSESVACHRDGSRWDLLYRVLWRLTHGVPHLLEILVDEDVHRMLAMDKSVRRDVHKMRAFVRFRLVERDGQSWYVAWFEPDHYIVERNAPFFVKRFAGMNWSILTPDRCAHWDGSEVAFTDGVSRTAAPSEDEWESLWLTYYRNIFNPARIKIHAMTSEMPKKYWKNLPEAAAIPALLEEAPARVKKMLAQSARKAE